MASFTARGSNFNPTISIHAAECSVAQAKKRGFWLEAITGATTLDEAKASLKAQLVEDGRDDIKVTICKCARKV